MAFIRITHARQTCVGCGFCAENAPDYWFINPSGEAQLHEWRGEWGARETGHAPAQDRDRLLAVATACPVGCIQIGP